MKKVFIIFVFLSLVTFRSMAQSDELIQKANADYDRLSAVFIDACGSFFDNANHHANTEKVHNFLDDNISKLKDFQSNCYDFNLMDLYQDCERFYTFVSGVETLTSWVLKHGGECDEVQWRLIDEALRGFNWTSNVLNVKTSFALFTEYTSPDGFKMMVVKNTLPDNNLNNAPIPSTDNYIKINYTYTNGAGGMVVVKPGCTDIIQFKDDENPHYYKLLKAEAEKGVR